MKGSLTHEFNSAKDRTALHIAAEQGDDLLVKSLLDRRPPSPLEPFSRRPKPQPIQVQPIQPVQAVAKKPVVYTAAVGSDIAAPEKARFKNNRRHHQFS